MGLPYKRVFHMADLGVLLSYYGSREDAQEALSQLRRKRFRKSASIHKSSDSSLHYNNLPLNRRWIWGIRGMLAGVIIAGVVTVGSDLSLFQDYLVPFGLITLIGGLLGWLITPIVEPKVPRSILEKHARWLVDDETLVVVQATPESMGWAVPLLRRIGESQPSIFALHPKREFETPSSPLRHAPLSRSQLQQHAVRMAEEHRVEPSSQEGEPLLDRLAKCEQDIEQVRRDLTEASRLEQSISPSAEWILDNAYIVQGHINDVQLNLPKPFYHELPVLTSAHLRSEPRVYAMALELVRHTDGRLDRDTITHFLENYQSRSVLTIGELWAMPLMLRIALIGSLCQLAEQVVVRLLERELADFWANRLLTFARREPTQLFTILAELSNEHPYPSAYFASQLTSHLYDEEAALIPVQSWLERSLHQALGNISLQEQGRQAADQIYIGNAITSLRELSQLDWREIFEVQSRVERILLGDPLGVYGDMDFATRDRYRGVVEVLSRSSGMSEEEVGGAAIELASEQSDDNPDNSYSKHVGYFLIDEGRKILVEKIHARESRRFRALQWVYRSHTRVYLGAIALMTILWASIAIVMAVATGERTLYLPLAAVVTMLPASHLAVQVTNYLLTRLLPPKTLPKMSFEKTGIPDSFRTLVIIPMLMVDEETIQDEVEKLEIRYLANPQANLLFGIFGDFADAETQHTESDLGLLKLAKSRIENLNEKYGANRFYLLNRDREWCETEGRYIGWERKRGKLEELNRLISGDPPRHEEDIVYVGDSNILDDVRFVITLDSDTQLPQDSARRMIETLAHPLNQPRGANATVGSLGAYTIIQPRVSTSLPSATATVFSRLFTDPVGSDPYTKAVSDVYQDLSGEGSYHGKGIYDPRSFYQMLGHCFPEQTLLSHDLIEGAHVRAGLASDVELFDEFPEDYQTYARRLHRWIRGDWQIFDWWTRRVPDPDGERVVNPLSPLNRWKIFDNLRRSLVQPGLLLFLASAWLYSAPLAVLASILVALLMLFQPMTQLMTWITTPRGVGNISPGELVHDVVRSVVETALIPHQASLALDAILRVWYRRLISRKNLLEWTASQMARWQETGRSRAFLLNMGMVSVFSLALGLTVWFVSPASLPAASPFLGLWFFSPLIAWRLNTKPVSRPQRDKISRDEIRMLRKVARKTWRYFDDFVDEDNSWLPPDNYQVSHQNQLALRTSPTNIGLWLISALGAHDFGYLTPDQVLHRLLSTFSTLDQLELYQGHLLNWYDIATLTPLEPRYVSTVDSGNLLASLWTLEAGIRELTDQALIAPKAIHGLQDTLSALQEELIDKAEAASYNKQLQELESLLGKPSKSLMQIATGLRDCVGPICTLADQLRENAGVEGGSAYWARQLARQVLAWVEVLDCYLPWLTVLIEQPLELKTDLSSELEELIDQSLVKSPSLNELAKMSSPHLHRLISQLKAIENPPQGVQEWIEHLDSEMARSRDAAQKTAKDAETIIQSARDLAIGMNMRFLYDWDRRLFTIGYNVNTQRHDGSYYDLLASEARLGSFVAIARGDVPTEHWLAMNRPFGSIGRRRVLLSWTGTMFEYLMPNLLQKTFENSLLAKASREAVNLQIEYGRRRGVPWGISESAYGDLDANLTYQYKAFGVPGLGLKRGLEEDLVVAPYASMLGLTIDPVNSVRNLKQLTDLGMSNGYGYYEAIDFGRRREREGEPGVLVRTFMAHHQAMAFLALVNFIHDQAMQRRFHSDPRVRAAEPLLYERIPISPPLYHLPSRGRPPARVASVEVAPSVSKFDTPHTDTPKTQLLCNGRYAFMVTNAGGGYSRWGDFDLTRWRSDPTRDAKGSFCYLRDRETGETWSSTYHPSEVEPDSYAVRFAIDRAEISRSDNGIDTETVMFVSPEDDVEIRRITLINHSNQTRKLDVTSYLELALAPHSADRQHPAFNKLFIETESLPESKALVAFRRPRSPDDLPIWVGHRLTFDQEQEEGWAFETDRRKFVGRGRTLANSISHESELSNSEGHVLDPIFSIRQSVELSPGGRVRFSMVFCASDSREGVEGLLEKYRDRQAIARGMELAWAHSQLELRLLGIQPDDARRFQKLASYLLYNNSKLRPPPERLRQNQFGQARLWPHGISGDLPIAVVTIEESRDIGVVRQMLQAHTYWKHHGLIADLVILNEESSSYEQPLHEQLTGMIQGHSMYTGVDHPGGVFLRNVDQLPEEDLNLILAVASVSLVAARGPLPQQLGTPGEVVELPKDLPIEQVQKEPSSPLLFMELEFFNGIGGFTPDGKEYVIQLEGETQTPAPWVNVMANPTFGTLVSDSGSGFTWNGNSQTNRLTHWSNDPISDPPSETIYIRDDETGEFWSPTPLPIREPEGYRIRHGAGYTVFEHNSHSIEQVMTTFVPLNDHGGEPVRVQRLELRNDSSRPRKLSVTLYLEWVLGSNPESSSPHIVTNWDREGKILLARNRYHPDYGDLIAFATMSPAPETYTADRTVFLGRNHSLSKPDAMGRATLSERTGAGLDPCAALQVSLELEPGETREVTCLLGQVESIEEIHRLVRIYRENLALEESLGLTKEWWDRLLSRIKIQTPEGETDALVNRWLLYQTLSCRIWGRSGFYQSGGAYGFRDQLQDVLALIYSAPDIVREHILLSAGRQFREGDVQHWWHPPSGAGIRSRCSDDLLWLPYVVSQYVKVTGNRGILDVQIPFIASRLLEEDEQEAYLLPNETMEQATIFEHSCRAIERSLQVGAHGLPLIGLHDWNDGMNRVGIEGKGESVWLAWFLILVLNEFVEISRELGQLERAETYLEHVSQLTNAIEAEAWDGEWYRRAYFDDGTPLGSTTNEEGRIDSLPQSWAQISGAAPDERASMALSSAWNHLVKEDEKLVLLFDPPFDKSTLDPGYIKGYPPGVRENGGQYTHAAIWMAIAFARQGDGDRAVRILDMLNPMNHTREMDDLDRYLVEPYVLAADVYRLPGRVGQGGWTWYTGSAGWMYRAWIEEILGLRIHDQNLFIKPVVPSSWDHFSMQYWHGDALYELTVENPEGVGQGVAWIEVDGRRLETPFIPLEDHPIKHKVTVRMGTPSNESKIGV